MAVPGDDGGTRPPSQGFSVSPAPGAIPARAGGESQGNSRCICDTGQRSHQPALDVLLNRH